MEVKTEETIHFYGEKPADALEKRQYVAVTYRDNASPTVYIGEQIFGASMLPELTKLLDAAKALIERRENENNAR